MTRNEVGFKHKANMIAGERFPNPIPLLPEDGWTRFANGVVGGSFAKFRDSEKFQKAVAEILDAI